MNGEVPEQKLTLAKFLVTARERTEWKIMITYVLKGDGALKREVYTLYMFTNASHGLLQRVQRLTFSYLVFRALKELNRKKLIVFLKRFAMEDPKLAKNLFPRNLKT